jgi:hypothetical protein
MSWFLNVVIYVGFACFLWTFRGIIGRILLAIVAIIAIPFLIAYLGELTSDFWYFLGTHPYRLIGVIFLFFAPLFYIELVDNVKITEKEIISGLTLLVVLSTIAGWFILSPYGIIASPLIGGFGGIFVLKWVELIFARI